MGCACTERARGCQLAQAQRLELEAGSGACPAPTAAAAAGRLSVAAGRWAVAVAGGQMPPPAHCCCPLPPQPQARAPPCRHAWQGGNLVFWLFRGRCCGAAVRRDVLHARGQGRRQVSAESPDTLAQAPAKVTACSRGLGPCRRSAPARLRHCRAARRPQHRPPGTAAAHAAQRRAGAARTRLTGLRRGASRSGLRTRGGGGGGCWGCDARGQPQGIATGRSAAGRRRAAQPCRRAGAPT